MAPISETMAPAANYSLLLDLDDLPIDHILGYLMIRGRGAAEGGKKNLSRVMTTFVIDPKLNQ